eukprot:Skav209325  [mRNA]  locus=scaffold724:316801:339675:- [translate_table: standard]
MSPYWWPPRWNGSNVVPKNQPQLQEIEEYSRQQQQDGEAYGFRGRSRTPATMSSASKAAPKSPPVICRAGHLSPGGAMEKRGRLPAAKPIAAQGDSVVTTLKGTGILTGYPQGFDRMAGMCLLALSSGEQRLRQMDPASMVAMEENAFWLLARLMEDVLDPDFFGADVKDNLKMVNIGGLGLRSIILEKAKGYCKTMFNTLGQEVFESCLGTLLDGWVLSCFIGCAPYRLLEHFWDPAVTSSLPALPTVHRLPAQDDARHSGDCHSLALDGTSVVAPDGSAVERGGSSQRLLARVMALAWEACKRLILRRALPRQKAFTTKRQPIPSMKKKQHQPRQPEISLLPDDIHVPEGIFQHSGNAPVGQIPLSQIGPEAQGVTIATAQEAAPFLQMSQPISSKGLAILILDHTNETVKTLGSYTRFPARCTQTNEPMIVSARLVNLGTLQIARSQPSQKMSVEESETFVLRITAFKDEMDQAWESFIQRPVKTILNELGFTGGTDRETQIVDVWDRQWLTHKMGKSQSSSASLFAVNLRLANVSIRQLLSKSGTSGFYAEPRDESGRHTHDDYRVVWLPNLSKGETMAALQTSPHWTSLIRHGNRFGLRTCTQHADSIHSLHRPKVPYLSSAQLRNFSVGPMPFNCTRDSLSKMFELWGWRARAIQPKGRAADGTGVLWHVQAEHPPVSEVFQMHHSDVIVTEDDGKHRPGPSPPVDVLASAKTVAALRNQSMLAGGNPQQDPWAPESHTYKSKSTIDHIWLSREFAPWLQEVGMDSTWFADHSILYAKLRMPFVKRPPEIWIKPHALPWDDVTRPNECAPADVDGKSSSEVYTSIVTSLEHYVDNALLSQGKRGLAPTQRGRATTVETKRVQAQAPPLKRARPHDVQVSFIGEHWQHYQWFRQLRRLIIPLTAQSTCSPFGRAFLQLQAHFLNIGRRAVRHGSTRPIDPADADGQENQHEDVDPPVPIVADDAPILFDTLPDWAQRSESVALGTCGPDVYNWLHVLTTSEDSRVSFVSMYQLTVSYQLFSQSIGLVLLSKSWVPGEQAFPQGIRYKFLNQSKHFAHFLKTLGRAFGMKVVGTFRRPTCTEMIPVWCRCYRMSVSDSMMKQVDERLRDHRSSPYVKLKRDFQDFPIASGP